MRSVMHTMTCRQNDWYRVTHTHRPIVEHYVPMSSSCFINNCQLKLTYSSRSPGKISTLITCTTAWFFLQALHARLVQALPFSFGSLRFASSFKVMRKLLNYFCLSRSELYYSQLICTLTVCALLFCRAQDVYKAPWKEGSNICTSWLVFKVSFLLFLSLILFLL